jgi:hypothetical protein
MPSTGAAIRWEPLPAERRGRITLSEKAHELPVIAL